LAVSQQHCGTCFHECTEGCDAGLCRPVWGECITKASGFKTCNDYCLSIGEACVEAGCGVEMNATVATYGAVSDCEQGKPSSLDPEACSLMQPWSLNREIVQCCCSETG
jgi:hypothetical protein